MRSLFVFLMAAFFSNTQANEVLREDLINNLYTIKNIFRSQYAPMAWKKKFAN